MVLAAPSVGPEVGRDLPLTAAQLQSALNTNEDVSGYVTSAIRRVEADCGPVMPCSWTYAASCGESGVLALPSGPLAEVTALVDPEGTDRVDDLTTQDVTWAKGIIRVGRFSALTGTWLVTVQTARDEAAVADLTEAVRVIAKHLREAFRARDVRSGASTDEDPLPVGVGFAVPNRAMDLMRDHLLPPLFQGQSWT